LLMSALRAVLIVATAAFFTVACGTHEGANHNASPGAGANANSGSASGTPTVSAPAANANQAAQVASTTSPTEEKKKEEGKAPGPPKPASQIDAAGLYVAQKCAGCHGLDGKGKIKGARDFTDAAWQKKESDAELARQIRNGEPPKMPAYKDKLSEEEIKALVAYIRTFAK
jgi:mono/diheme cytochrome c family protein